LIAPLNPAFAAAQQGGLALPQSDFCRLSAPSLPAWQTMELSVPHGVIYPPSSV
jgi:hypothetical protein